MKAETKSSQSSLCTKTVVLFKSLELWRHFVNIFLTNKTRVCRQSFLKFVETKRIDRSLKVVNKDN